MNRWIPAIIVASAVILIAPASMRAADITGTYSCAGKNPDGKGYSGKVEITKNGDTFRIKWTLVSTESYEGIGILANDVLAVAFSVDNKAGVVSYKVEKGKLVGKWAVADGKGTVYTETLTKE